MFFLKQDPLFMEVMGNLVQIMIIKVGMRTSPRNDGMFQLPKGKACDLAVQDWKFDMNTGSSCVSGVRT